jgi:hypothetical protein
VLAAAPVVEQGAQRLSFRWLSKPRSACVETPRSLTALLNWLAGRFRWRPERPESAMTSATAATRASAHAESPARAWTSQEPRMVT